MFCMSEADLYDKDLKIKEHFRWINRFYDCFDLNKALTIAKMFDLDINKKFRSLSKGYQSIFKLTAALSLNIPYVIQYAIVGLITLIIGIVSGSFENVGTNCLEINTLFFVSILGALGFKEDFKTLIQNGFTRKYIFIAALSLFSFMSGIMAFIDTVVGNFLHYFNKDYTSLYSGIYGYDNIVMNWLWLFLVYVMFCCLLYLTILIINKIGKTMSIYCGILFIGCIVLITALFRYVFSAELVKNILNFFMKAAGFVKGDTINYFYPSFSLLLIIGILGTTSFVVIRRTELK